MSKVVCELCATPAGADQLVGEARDILLALQEAHERISPESKWTIRELNRAIKLIEKALKA